MSGKHNGKAAVATAASKGIGARIARHLVAEGGMRAAAEFSEAAVVRRYLDVFAGLCP